MKNEKILKRCLNRYKISIEANYWFSSVILVIITIAMVSSSVRGFFIWVVFSLACVLYFLALYITRKEIVNIDEIIKKLKGGGRK